MKSIETQKDGSDEKNKEDKSASPAHQEDDVSAVIQTPQETNTSTVSDSTNVNAASEQSETTADHDIPEESSPQGVSIKKSAKSIETQKDGSDQKDETEKSASPATQEANATTASGSMDDNEGSQQSERAAEKKKSDESPPQEEFEAINESPKSIEKEGGANSSNEKAIIPESPAKQNDDASTVLSLTPQETAQIGQESIETGSTESEVAPIESQNEKDEGMEKQGIKEAVNVEKAGEHDEDMSIDRQESANGNVEGQQIDEQEGGNQNGDENDTNPQNEESRNPPQVEQTQHEPTQGKKQIGGSRFGQILKEQKGESNWDTVKKSDKK
uniref:Uncharacterized protein n=1 Tax=Panagrellus redivivus TaxID=6233 RepID=A0A7E4VZ99_PANRE